NFQPAARSIQRATDVIVGAIRKLAGTIETSSIIEPVNNTGGQCRASQPAPVLWGRQANRTHIGLVRFRFVAVERATGIERAVVDDWSDRVSGSSGHVDEIIDLVGAQKARVCCRLDGEAIRTRVVRVVWGSE